MTLIRIIFYKSRAFLLNELYQAWFCENWSKVQFQFSFSSTFLNINACLVLMREWFPHGFFRVKLSSKLQSLMKNLIFHMCSSRTAFLKISAIIFQSRARPKIRSLLGLEEGVRASAQETLTKFLSATTRFISSDSNCTKLTCWFIRFI